MRQPITLVAAAALMATVSCSPSPTAGTADDDGTTSPTNDDVVMVDDEPPTAMGGAPPGRQGPNGSQAWSRSGSRWDTYYQMGNIYAGARQSISEAEIVDGLEVNYSLRASLLRINAEGVTDWEVAHTRHNGLVLMRASGAEDESLALSFAYDDVEAQIELLGAPPAIPPTLNAWNTYYFSPGGDFSWHLVMNNRTFANVVNLGANAVLLHGSTSASVSVNGEDVVQCDESCGFALLVEDGLVMTVFELGPGAQVEPMPDGGILSYASSFPVEPVRAYDATGSLMWEFSDFELPPQQVLFRNGRVVIYADDEDFDQLGAVILLNPETGAEENRLTPISLWGPAGMALGDRLLWTQGNDKVYAYDLETGEFVDDIQLIYDSLTGNARFTLLGVDAADQPIVGGYSTDAHLIKYNFSY